MISCFSISSTASWSHGTVCVLPSAVLSFDYALLQTQLEIYSCLSQVHSWCHVNCPAVSVSSGKIGRHANVCTELCGDPCAQHLIVKITWTWAEASRLTDAQSWINPAFLSLILIMFFFSLCGHLLFSGKALIQGPSYLKKVTSMSFCWI